MQRLQLPRQSSPVHHTTRSTGTVHTSTKVHLTSIAIRIRGPDRHQNLIICSFAHCQPSRKFPANPLSFYTKLLTDRQTDKQQQSHILVGRGNNNSNVCIEERAQNEDWLRQYDRASRRHAASADSMPASDRSSDAECRHWGTSPRWRAWRTWRSCSCWALCRYERRTWRGPTHGRRHAAAAPPCSPATCTFTVAVYSNQLVVCLCVCLSVCTITFEWMTSHPYDMATRLGPI